jgi:hypothetical protein
MLDRSGAAFGFASASDNCLIYFLS